MNFKRSVISSSLVAILSTACGGGGGSSAPADTTNKTGQISAAFGIACVDSNHNWQCDDGDVSLKTLSGLIALSPLASEYVLFEQRDLQNQRTQLLISELGKSRVDGQSTLKTLLGKAWNDSLATKANAELEAGFAAALQTNPLAVAALQGYAQSVAGGAKTAAPAAQTAVEVSSWQGVADENRALASNGSLVINNSESNRLYVFDTAIPLVKANEVDLIPALETVASQAGDWLRNGLEAVLSTVLMVDTVSAASSVVGQPTTENPVALPAGRGINSLHLLNSGKDALVLMNSGSGKYQAQQCASSGSEGVYKVALSGASYRNLAQSTACIHSGFTLLASEGKTIVAWDAAKKILWLLDSETLQSRRQIIVDVSAASGAQALSVSPGGRFAAVASLGQVAIVDLNLGQTIANLKGSWGNVSQVAFAAGQRQLLLASGSSVHGVRLDTAMQYIASTRSELPEAIRALAVAQDGESYVAVSDKQLYWQAVKGDQRLASSTLRAGLLVKRVTLAGDKALVLAQGAQDLKFYLYQIALSGMTVSMAVK